MARNKGNSIVKNMIRKEEWESRMKAIHVTKEYVRHFVECSVSYRLHILISFWTQETSLDTLQYNHTINDQIIYWKNVDSNSPE